MTVEVGLVQEANIEVCYGPECSDVGGRRLTEELEGLGLKSRMGDCRNQCPNAPLVLVNNKMIVNATADKVLAKVEEQET
ncbi:MAG: (2Fe-2S) ferredoxin domain-containing protein [Ghiorsea sp.]